MPACNAAAAAPLPAGKCRPLAPSPVLARHRRHGCKGGGFLCPARRHAARASQRSATPQGEAACQPAMPLRLRACSRSGHGARGRCLPASDGTTRRGPGQRGLLRPARQCTVLASRRCRVAGQHHLPTCTTRQPLPPGRALTYRVKGVVKASKTAERQLGEGRCAHQAALPAGVIGGVPPWQVRHDRLLHPPYVLVPALAWGACRLLLVLRSKRLHRT